MTVNYDPITDNGTGTGTVPSPCINICKMDPASGLCEGCFRTIDEIRMWSTATNDVKRAVWVEIRRRQEALF